MCKVLGVTESGYYKSIRNRKTLSRREQRWADVLKNIYALLREDEENANYGMRRIYLGLKTDTVTPEDIVRSYGSVTKTDW